MKKKYALILLLFSLILVFVIRTTEEPSEIEKITKLREKHKSFLENSPYKKTRALSKKERKGLGIPPNGFFEQNWSRTIDPNLGYPNTKNALHIQHELIEQRKNIESLIVPRAPGDALDNAWVERGPSNIGGRTRGILFDPNDSNNERVFAGGVSGGLWVNNDITDANSSWTLVSGVPENIAVNQIIADPNNSNTLYIASGESYTTGDAIGNGVYRSTDGGVNWTMIFGGPDGTSTPSGSLLLLDGIFFINDIIARDVGATTELYITAASSFLPPGNSAPIGVFGNGQRGLYRSVNNGNTWSLVSITYNPGGGAIQINPNDLELDINNNIWLSTTSDEFGNPGGGIYRSTNGTSFTLINTIASAARTEIEPSQQDANVFYIAADRGEADLFVTTDAFATITQLSEPVDEDGLTITATDYARNQAFYDLPIEVDPTDDTILYIGGIDLFRGDITVDPMDGSRSIDTNDWDQISIWSTFFTTAISLVHADHHAIVFRPGNANQAVFGTDGGVYFGSNLASSGSSNNTITPRNNGYAVTQFYAGDINDVDGTMGGGTQDNGSPFNLNGDTSTNVDPFFTVIGGDGAYGQFDTDGDYFIASTQFIDYRFVNTPITGATNNFGGAAIPTVNESSYLITDRAGGNFINEADVDTNLDILYINASTFNSAGQLVTAQIGRYDNIENGSATVQETLLTNGLLTEVISALQTSPFETTASRLLIGTELGSLLNVENAQGTPVWTNISGAGFVGSISDVEFGLTENIRMVTFSNYGVTSIWYTDDTDDSDGVDWVSKEGDLPDIPVFAILQNPLNTNEAIVGTQFGVFRTENFLAASPNWIQSFNGMSNVPVRDLDLRPSTNEVLATTYGRGMFTGQFTANTLSTNDPTTAEKSIILSPTVSNGTFSLSSQKSFNDLTMEVYNISGQRIFESDFQMINNKAFSLNLNAGLYFVRISNRDFIEVKKIIIR